MLFCVSVGVLIIHKKFPLGILLKLGLRFNGGNKLNNLITKQKSLSEQGPGVIQGPLYVRNIKKKIYIYIEEGCQKKIVLQ